MELHHLRFSMFLVAGLVFAIADRAAPPTTKPSTAPGDGISLFDGKTLGQWKVTEYAGAGEPRVEAGTLILPAGERLTGVNWSGDAPKMDYEISFDAQRVDGTDFFVGLTFPIAETHASLILGGWGGATCGISNVDGEDAAHNDLRTFRKFENGQWYHIRLRVTATKLEAWVDKDIVVNLDTTGKKITLRGDIEESKPIGFASFATTAAVKEIKLTMLKGK